MDGELVVRAVNSSTCASRWSKRGCGNDQVGEWDFWELWAGCAQFIQAARTGRLIDGPPVDKLERSAGLQLDLEDHMRSKGLGGC